MDSGNSSSMQSSSGGAGDQEEFDSRSDQSISAFFNNNNTTTNITTGPSNLDSLIANYLNTGWSTDTPLWSTTPRPQPISSSEQQVFFTSPPPLQQQQQQNLRVSVTNTGTPMCSVPTDKKNGLTTIRNPKKRSRVSKRAPTTVLTTDTSNFRAMVQEFTGNPSTPFTGFLPSSSSSSTFPRSRFDHLFGPPSSSTTSMTYSSSSRPLKPFPHKLTPTTNHHHPYLIPPPSSDYHHHQNLLNMNTQNITNPFLNHQSHANPLPDQSLLCEKSKPLSLRTSFGHVDVGSNNFEGLQNIIASSSTQPTLNAIQGDKNSSDNNL